MQLLPAAFFVAAKFENALRRYLTRKIGFEAVMRIRCTRGLALHTFHGNFFVRSTGKIQYYGGDSHTCSEL